MYINKNITCPAPPGAPSLRRSSASFGLLTGARETVTILLDFPRDFGYIGKANIIVRLPLLGRAEP